MPDLNLHEPVHLGLASGAGAWLFEDGSYITWPWVPVTGIERVTVTAQAPHITASARTPSIVATGKPL